MDNFDRDHEQVFHRLDDFELEAVRAEMVASRDERLEQVVRVLVLRAVVVIENVCRTRGKARGLSRDQILRAIDDASARMLLRLERSDPQPTITAVAAEIAATCVDACEPEPAIGPRLAPRRPELRVVDKVADALDDGRIRRNDWRSS
jgi:hypothetical protein